MTVKKGREKEENETTNGELHARENNLITVEKNVNELAQFDNGA